MAIPSNKVFALGLLLPALTACGLEELLAEATGADTEAKSTQSVPSVPVSSDADTTRALFGEMFGSTFAPRSIVYATGINVDGLEETHIIAASARNYCEHIRDNIEEEQSLRVMLRVVRYTGDMQAGHVVPGDYEQVERPAYFNDTVGIAPPKQVPVKGGSGNALTAAVAGVRRGCAGQLLVAAAPQSIVTIDAHDFTGLRGHISLRFDNYGHGDSAGDGGDSLNGLPVRVGGTFTATPCPWLGSILNVQPQAPFKTNQCLSGR